MAGKPKATRGRGGRSTSCGISTGGGGRPNNPEAAGPSRRGVLAHGGMMTPSGGGPRSNNGPAGHSGGGEISHGGEVMPRVAGERSNGGEEDEAVDAPQPQPQDFH